MPSFPPGYPSAWIPQPLFSAPAPAKRKPWLAIVVVCVLALVGLIVVAAMLSEPPNRYTPGPPNLNPNEPPEIISEEAALLAIFNNPLYQRSVASSKCSVPNIDTMQDSMAKMEQQLNDLVVCLMMVWHPVVVESGFELPRPPVTVYDSSLVTPCGTVETQNAFYCSANQQIYYAKDFFELIPPNLQQARFLAESVIAHEVGHAVQYRTTILMSTMILQILYDDETTALDLNRRLEMQADCLTGVFFNSIATSVELSQADITNLADITRSVSGTVLYSDDHGHGDNRAYWLTQGIGSPDVVTCNTYDADVELVG
jgi:predicted metalloprotease